MKTQKGKKLFLSAVCILMVLFPVLGKASMRAPVMDPELGALINEFRFALESAKRSGKDTQGAEELDRQSRKAAGEGRPEQAKKILHDALSALKGRPGNEAPVAVENPPKFFAEPSNAPGSASKNSGPDTREGSFMESPFGIFGPYQFKLDSKGTVDETVINKYLNDVGVKWVQELPMGIEKVPANINIYSRVGREGGVKPPDIDYDKYRNELKKSMARFKNRVKYWEVDTEPSGLKPPQGWRGYSKEYAVFLRESYNIIKRECPDCKVVLGGVPGVAAAGALTGDSHINFLREILSQGAGKYFDVFAFKLHHHKASEYKEIKNKLQGYEKVFKEFGIDIHTMPIFLETAIYDGNPGYPSTHPLGFLKFPPQTETEQAAGLFKTYIFALSLGIDKVFWNEIFERHNFGGEPGNPFNFYGLVNNPLNDGKSHKKLEYYTYKKMVKVLEGADWKHIQKLKEQDGVYIYRFSRNGRSIIIAWNDNPTPADIEIPGIKSRNVKVTYAVPDRKSGLEVQEFENSFKSQVMPADSNKSTLRLDSIPVYIEEM